MNLKEFINKLQNLPLVQKKLILWAIVGVLAFFLGFFWVKSIENRLKNFNSENVIKQLNVPVFEKEKLEFNLDEGKEQIKKEKKELETSENAEDKEFLEEPKKELENN